MLLAEMRTVLLRQHDLLRVKIQLARQLVARWGDGEELGEPLRECMQSLKDELIAHNEYEETALGQILPKVDAWGSVRRDVMVQEHMDEHRHLCSGLIDALSAPRDEGARAIAALLQSLTDHIRHEEELFLAADVLTDDVAARDYFGG